MTTKYFHVRFGHNVLKAIGFLVFLTVLTHGSLAATGTLIFSPSKGEVALRPYFRVIEDSGQNYTATDILKSPGLLQPLAGFKFYKQTDAFWLMARLNGTEKTAANIYFNHLSYADLYFMADTPGAKLVHHRAGAFRPIAEIAKGDSRFDFAVRLDSNVPYIVLIKSRHTKNYPPVFDFYLSERYVFLETKYKNELNDLWPQGASALLFIYIFLRWLSTRYRPFIWLMLFVAAFNLYGIALNRYLVDWFFPSAPISGWLLVQHFLHFGLIGLYLLLFDSWNLEQKDLNLYKWGKGFVYGLLLLSISVFLNNSLTSNYRLSAMLTISFLVPLFIYSIGMLIRIWKKLDRLELLLAYGLICYLAVSIFCSAGVSIYGEYYYTIIPGVTKAVSVFIAFLFLMGLNGRLRQNALDKTRYLKELTLLQQHQNELLEASVAERTAELSSRNAHIETLMNEFNHRVKNNLQMLYSLNSLRLTAKNHADVDSILRDNISRIKAMMLVNEHLQLNENEQPFALKPFVESIIAHSSQVFEAEQKVNFKIAIKPGFILESRLGLPLGLIISELIVNSYKHAFRNSVSPEISIGVVAGENTWQLCYSDNGCGMPENAPVSFGTNLIHDLARQIQSRLHITQEQGLTYTLTFSTSLPCES